MIISKNGEVVSSGYSYDEATKTLSTMLAFCTIDAGHGSTINSGNCSTINAGYSAAIDAGDCSKIDAGYRSKINAGHGSTIDAGDRSTIDAGDSSKINAGYGSTINAGYGSTINAGYGSTIDAGHSSVIIRRDIFEVIVFKNPRKISLCPYDIPGYIENGVYSVTGKPAIVADGVLSEIVYTRKNKSSTVYTVINYGSTNKTYLIESGGIFSHGDTLSAAKESLRYKISNRVTSAYDSFTMDTKITLDVAIKMYRVITGACESETRRFVESRPDLPKKMTVAEMIKITTGKYNSDLLVKFFSKENDK